MPLVGLTGGMGAGKSTALRVLEELGARVVAADEIVHDLYREDPVRAAVVERWGPMVAPEGVVDRKRVAACAFASDRERSWLEGLLWPLVGERIEQWVKAQERLDPAPAALVVESPLLFEAGMEDGYDATIAVIAREEIRSERAAGRGHVGLDERAARQLPQLEKARRATFAVSNDGDRAQLRERLREVLGEIERRFVG